MTTFNKHQIADLLVLTVLLALVLGYCWDAYNASSQVINLILVLPLTGLVFILCAIEFINQWRKRDQQAPELEPFATIVPVVSLFAAYVVTLPWLGFDVGTCLFIALFLWCHGERRWRWLLGYSLCFASLMTWFFSQMLPYPLPMLILPTEY
ncbi:tripartite tricarboxylate transporter TctB family protein [Pseudomonadales bacterium]|uniref:tripartite tricarboxylate transporter TctB family protein n=1 Tax=Oceanicoccus sp. TaxID=2691044 RepID=UPI0023740B48|nr:tripartite tricarboxylate transporter TctB family protein [Oceanicoccus sp.]MCP3907629.1 tripartite tricarboxylate transporter TctB family protein [Oceanicoccus sp.]MDB4528481.1 tripartite tricarboxylate transporter TctB family protein [Pseudomonadales bacterium]MDB4631631.1 tripartite tricarboxylate transporter TctB family protein [Pseudomonadales bacterium]MDG1773585.1 tripartite tricarboxylate transporter TctB family protein [Oceanicoccus sp.]